MNKYLISVTGKNIRNFLLKGSIKKINILNIHYINNNQVNILIKKEDLELLNEIKGIYEYKIIKEYGTSNIKKKIFENIHILILICISVVFISFISNYIYEVEIIENDYDLKEFVSKVLEEKGIKSFNKKPKDLAKIKEEILKENKDKIEWIEIIESGVKYIIKVEERIEREEDYKDYFSDIVAKKDGIIKKIVASSGKIIVEKDMFVKKGDTLITGIIDEDNFVKSEGEIFAHTWYKVSSEASLHKSSYEVTNNKKKGLKIKFFNKEILFYKKYRTSKIKEKVVFKNIFLPVYLSIDEITETNVVDHILTIDEAKIEATKKARESIINKLGNNAKIISENQLKVLEKDSKIIVEILFTMYETISEEKRIEVLNVQRDYRSGNQ